MTINYISRIIIQRLTELNVIILKIYKSKTGTVYINILQQNKKKQIRVSDHDSNWRYDYNFNINNIDISLKELDILFDKYK
jgi:hypothetical protein